MDKIYKCKAFKSLGKVGRKLKDHIIICVHHVYNVKQDERHKTKLVVGGHMAGPLFQCSITESNEDDDFPS
eukprot:15182461-Ditylum_brightwellii.AAC.1